MSIVFKSVSPNNKGRDFVIGDIHGHKKRFVKALESVGFNQSRDRLFCTGDLIDRGKENLFILNALREEWFFAVRGNHEQKLINRFEYPLVKPTHFSGIKTKFEAEESHRLNGGRWFDNLHSSLAKQRIYQNLSALPCAIALQTEFGDIGFVHAEVPNRFESWSAFVEALNSEPEVCQEAMWNRLEIEAVYDTASGRYWEAELKKEPRFIQGITLSVHGHTTSHEPIVHGNQVWIDTGYKTGELTILEVNKLRNIAK